MVNSSQKRGIRQNVKRLNLASNSRRKDRKVRIWSLATNWFYAVSPRKPFINSETNLQPFKKNSLAIVNRTSLW